jgi:CheY-specific phosphatase CheX
MFEEFFGNYLVSSNKLTTEQFTSVKTVMKSARVKLGLIAVAEKLLTEQQADEVNRLQAMMDKRFGDIAVEKGYLTDEQVGHLLSMQGNPYLQFVQAVTESNYMTMAEVEDALSAYQVANNFSDEDIAAIKSGDVDKIAAVFVNSDSTIANDLISLAVRNIIRFISTEVNFDKITVTDTYEYEHLATQAVRGDHSILLAFSGNNDNLLAVANPFAKEEFTEVDADSYDSVCEFINCINGLFASALSKDDVNIDMEPPLFFDNGKLKSEKIYSLPMNISGKAVSLVVIVDTEYEVN